MNKRKGRRERVVEVVGGSGREREIKVIKYKRMFEDT